jgi:hypothetical protein
LEKDMEDARLSERFKALLEQGAAELFEDNQNRMSCPELFESRHEITDEDLRLFFLGVECGVVSVVRGARFNTRDRPIASGRWGLLSREKSGCRYNSEYLPQIAAYVEAINYLGYSSERVFFELPHAVLKLDLAILSDETTVIVLGEAKRAVNMLDNILKNVEDRYGEADPGEEGRNEARQLAWSLWRTQAPYLWLIGPGNRRAYRVHYTPLAFQRLAKLPRAEEIGLAHVPPRRLSLPNLRVPLVPKRGKEAKTF